MKLSSALTCLSLLSFAACAPAGYYDTSGQYHAYGRDDSYRTDKPMAATPTDAHPDYYATQPAPGGTTTIIYDRPGYYDYNGYYIDSARTPSVPADYLPPHGMCRVWFTDRDISQQPRVESCGGIQNRVPVGAYVIYGG